MKDNFFKRLFRITDIKEKGDGLRLFIRYLFSAIGVLCIGIGCGVVVEMALGCDTYTSFNRGLWYILTEAFGNFPFGHINLSVNLILFVLMLIFCREHIGFGTLFNMVAVGYIIDIVQYVFGKVGVEGSTLSAILRSAVIIAALPVIAFGGALYIEAKLGVSPFDAVPFIFEKLMGVKNFGLMRTLTDCICLVGGFFFGLVTGKQFELVNIGTVILALFTGVLIHGFRKLIVGKGREDVENSH